MIPAKNRHTRRRDAKLAELQERHSRKRAKQLLAGVEAVRHALDEAKAKHEAAG